MAEPLYTENDLREAFKAGWKERNRSPGLKRKCRKSFENVIGGAIGQPRRQMTADYVPDHKTYHNSIWLRWKKARPTQPNGACDE